jgi:hypothetical protein
VSNFLILELNFVHQWLCNIIVSVFAFGNSVGKLKSLRRLNLYTNCV